MEFFSQENKTSIDQKLLRSAMASANESSIWNNNYLRKIGKMSKKNKIAKDRLKKNRKS